jgi:nitroreductase
LCTCCGDCVLSCPWNIFILKEKIELVNEDLCISCGQCVAICKEKAISHLDISRDTIIPINKEKLPSLEQILELLRARRSIRAFLDKPVEKEKIEKIVYGSCFAPSANNLQTTRYLAVEDKELIKKISRLTLEYIVKRKRLRFFSKLPLQDYEAIVDAYKKGIDLILHNPPLLLFFYAEKGIGGSDVNACLALQNATYIVQALGLGCFYAGYVVAASKYKGRIQRLLGIPKNCRIYGCLAIGYPKIEFENWIERKKPKLKWR